MNFDQASADLPANVREFLRTSLAEHGIPENDPIRAAVLAQAALTVYLDRRRNKAFGVMAVVCAALIGLAWMRPHQTSVSPAPVMAKSSSLLDGKDLLIVDTKTWNLDAWLHADKTYFFPPKTSSRTTSN
jgi:hypothetical protein